MTISLNAYSDLLMTLYSTPPDVRWQSVLDKICEHTQSTQSLLISKRKTSGVRIIAHGGRQLRVERRRPGSESLESVDRLGRRFDHSSQRCVLEEAGPPPCEEIVKTDFFRKLLAPDLLAPDELHYTTSMVLSASPHNHELVSVWQGADRPHVEQAMQWLSILAPHLQNALELRQAVGIAERRAQNAEALLDASSDASLLLNATGRILYSNSHAKALALRADGIRVHGDRLSPADASQRSAFEALVRESAHATAPHKGSAIALSRPSGKRPLQVFVAPLRIADASRSAGRVLVTITDPEQSGHISEAVLRQLYALTAAEAEIANGLLSGFSIDEIAHLRKVSVATVRSQMKGLLAKTDTRRQGELIRLLATLPKAVAACAD